MCLPLSGTGIKSLWYQQSHEMVQLKRFARVATAIEQTNMQNGLEKNVDK